MVSLLASARQRLTAAQSGIWFAGATSDPGATFGIGDYIEISGRVRPGLLAAAHGRTAREVEACRVSFVEGDDGPVQVLGERPGWPLYRVDCTGRPAPREYAREWMAADMDSPVDLSVPVLCSAALFKIADDRYLYYRRAHHIIMDGWSLDLTARRTADIYTALDAGRTPAPPSFGPLNLLLDEDDAYRASPRFRRDREFWLRTLTDAPEPPTLSARRTPGPRGTRRATCDLGRDRVTGLRSAAERMGVSWPVLVIAVAAAYVMRLTGTADVTLGMPVSGRTTRAQRDIVGMTANIVPLRLHCEPSMSWEEFAHSVRARVRQATAHGRYPTENMARDLGLVGRGQTAYGPLVNVMAFEHDIRFGEGTAVCRSVRGMGVEDVAFTVRQLCSDDLELIVDANPLFYGAEETDEHRDRLRAFLDTVITGPPRAPVTDTRLLRPVERETLLGWGTAPHDETPGEVVPDLFQRRVRACPDAPAVEYAGRRTTYAELDASANQLARLLVAKGIGPGDVVALALPRSTRLVTAMAAVLKSGAAYLPLDPAYPSARLAYMVNDAEPAVMLVDSTTAARMQGLDVVRLSVDDPDVVERTRRFGTNCLRDADRVAPLTPEHPAYVIYTSGSTGSPKGVVVPHRGAANLHRLAAETFGMDPSVRLLQFVSPSFDMSVADVWMTLLTGGTLVVADKERLLPGAELEQLMAQTAVTHVMLPPSTLQVLSPERVSPSVTVVVAGEACAPHVVENWSVGRRLINAYGPTEATVYATASSALERHQASAPPIGRPVPGFRVYVLDGRLDLVPAGAPGELYIAGRGLALGYLGRPGLTAQRFVPDPFGPPGSRMYRTGDVVRWTTDGQLVFLHRNDDQVKVRGFRIELGEIESVLLRCPGVGQAMVAVRDGLLVAGVVAEEGHRLEAGALRARLREEVPDHLVPLITVLDALPVTPSGKADRAALPAPGSDRSGVPDVPLTPAQARVARLVEEVLRIATPGPDDDFFELGGDSLSATRLIGRMGAVLGVRPTMREFFTAPTVAGLAGLLNTTDETPASGVHQ